MQFITKIVLLLSVLLTVRAHPANNWKRYCDRGTDCKQQECDERCKQIRPFDQPPAGLPTWTPDNRALWAADKFECATARRESKFWPWEKAYCYCEGCYRYCQLDEIYETSACDIADIPTIKNDVNGKIEQAIMDFAIDTAIGQVDQYTFGLMGLGKNIFDATGDDNDFLNRVIIEANERNQQMMECMGEMIDELRGDMLGDSMQFACEHYTYAMDYTYHQSVTKSYRDEVEDTWREFDKTVSVKFDKDARENEAIYFKNNLALTQDFALLFSLTSFEYLMILKNDGDLGNYDKYLDASLDAFDNNLREWVYAARNTIIKEMNDNMNKIACSNGDEIEDQIAKWEERFRIANIDPIEQYIGKLNDLKYRSPLKEGEECEKPKSIHVLSIDHSSARDGQYFNFDVEDFSGVFLGGISVWNHNAYQLTVRNRRDGVSQKVIVWNSPSGGSIGDGRGRRYSEVTEQYSSAGDWEVGDVLDYRPGYYSTCVGDYTFCYAGTGASTCHRL